MRHQGAKPHDCFQYPDRFPAAFFPISHSSLTNGFNYILQPFILLTRCSFCPGLRLPGSDQRTVTLDKRGNGRKNRHIPYVFVILCHFDQKYHGNLTEFQGNPLCYDTFKEIFGGYDGSDATHGHKKRLLMVLMGIIIVVMGNVAHMEKAKKI
jgi:hypothetical protein